MLLSIGKISKKYCISKTLIRQWIKSGLIKEIRTPGGHFRIKESEILNLLGV